MSTVHQNSGELVDWARPEESLGSFAPRMTASVLSSYSWFSKGANEVNHKATTIAKHNWSLRPLASTQIQITCHIS